LIEKLCHRTLELDQTEKDEFIIIGAPCIRTKCIAWQENEMMTGGGFCKDLNQR
jgi:hypothetical protein